MGIRILDGHASAAPPMDAWSADNSPDNAGPIEAIKDLHARAQAPRPWHHAWALTVKSVLLKVRSPVATTAELLLPVVFATGLVAIWATTSDTDHAAKSFGGPPLSFEDNASAALCVQGTAPVAGVRRCLANDTLVKCSNSSLIPVQGLCAVVAPAPLWQGFVASFDQPRRVPALDTLIAMQWLMHIDGAEMGSLYSAERGLFLGGYLYFAPPGNATTRLMSHLANTSVLFQHVNRGAVADDGALKAVVRAAGRTLDQPPVGLLVGVNAWTNGTLNVTYFTNRTATPLTQITEDIHAVGLGEKGGRTYITAGVPTMMQAVMETYAEEFGLAAPATADMTAMPYLAYTDYEFINTAGGFVATFLVFGYLFSVSQLTRVLVEEKESRIREAMHVMGLGVLSFYVSWLATYTVMALVTSLLLALLFCLTILGKAAFFVVFLSFFLFALSVICFSVLLSALFWHSRVSSFVGPALFFVLALPAVMLPGSNPPAEAYLAFSVFSSPVTFARTANQLLEWEKTTGASFSNIGTDPDGYSLQLTFIMFAVNCVTYLVFGLYLDAVLEPEWGTSRRCCFCFCLCGCCSKPADRGCGPDGKPRDGRDPKGVFEDVGRAVPPTVRLGGLRKEFDAPGGRTTAVNDLTLDLYEGEVTVLLGHNGAGKTTAINMMTGMADMTAGHCELYGASVRDDLKAARREVGMCPQHNILWDDLTCEEHLRFFARLKGFTGSDLDDLVDATLLAVDLADKANARSVELSGGQKRKLSVANAFVGGARVVFLDEPTAGMDVGARRFTWDLIKQMSPGRTIVLTTHFMDEADLLGNSVAIMVKGRLKCMGSPVFLKSRLGAGYTLTLSCLPHAQPHHVTQQVQARAHGAAVLSSSAGELSLQVPMSDVPALPAVLAMLEQDMAALGVQSYALSLTTLEEIFLKQAEEDEEAEAAQPTPEPTVVQTAVPIAPLPAKDAMAVVAETLWGDVPKAAWTQPVALLMKRVHNMKRDRRAQVLQVVVPVVFVGLALLFSLMNFDITHEVSARDMYEGTEIATAACPPRFNTFGPPAQYMLNTALPNGSALSDWLATTAASHSIDRVSSFACGSRDGAPAGAVYLDTDPALVLYNETGFPHSAVFAAHAHGAMALRASGNRTLVVDTRISQLPLTSNEADLVSKNVDAFVGLMLIIPFALIPSTFVAWVVRERQCKAKHLQSICGMHFALYWACNFVFDALCYVVTAGVVFGVLLAFSRDEYVGGGGAFGATLLLFVFYGASSITAAYLASFLFSEFSTAQNVVMMLNFVMGVIVVLTHFILDAVPSTESFAGGVVFALRIHPSFCFGHGMLQLAAAGAQHNTLGAFKPLGLDATGWDILYMALGFPLAAAATLVLDRPNHLAAAQGVPEIIDAEDSDVAAERAAVEEGRQNDAAVLLSSLRKEYTAHGRTKVAVKNLSLAVQRGEVFGFLGTNGAGKTTTMSMLCGEFAPTSGRAWIAGKNIVTEAGEVRKMLGYCPQFDALLDLLTVEEHLELYAGLRGLSGADRTRAVDALIEACDLAPHRSKESRALSGGNKRKLSVAISLVGGPQVVFLDEPSAGMDPKARRGMWDVLEIVAKHCCIVLTTHHLEEIEALATRVAIMDQGEMKCLGSLQHLKAKFGTGYEMALRVQNETHSPKAEAFVARSVAGAHLQESRGGRLTYNLPRDARLSAVFALLEGQREELHLTDYTVSQSSLETVFLNIQAGGAAQHTV